MKTDKSLFNRRDLLAGGVVGAAGFLSGCAALQPTDDTGTDGPTGSLETSIDSGVVGDPIQLLGSNLPTSETVDLLWHSVEGSWGLASETEIVEPQFVPRTDHVETVTTDGSGEFSYDWTLPEDYGGNHAIEVQASDGTTLARTSVEIGPSFEIDRTHAPLGESFTVTAHGLGIGGYTSEYVLAWDNGVLGIVTAITSRGRAEAMIPAAGPVGEHVLRVGRGWTGVIYLNLQQSPYEPPDFPTWIVEVTEPKDDLATGRRLGDGRQPDAASIWEAVQGQYPDAGASSGENNDGAAISVSPVNGSIGDPMTVTGTGLASHRTVDIVWLTKRGNRVESGFHTQRVPLGAVTTDGEGHFSIAVHTPDDLGGAHPIVAEIDGSPVAVTAYNLLPSAVGITPASGPIGTEFTVHIKGVGWTEYDNTYAVTYDNHFLGYACGFNSGGDVQIPLTASGPPGYHTIDLYPSVYKGINEGTMPDFYTKPQLSYRTDHPGRTLPAFRFIFQTSES